jgi:hypothetical protein
VAYVDCTHPDVQSLAKSPDTDSTGLQLRMTKDEAKRAL